jgi:hypothetical protein
LWDSQTADHPENNLAKFGYIRYEGRKKFDSFYILGYLLEVIIRPLQFGKKKFQKFGEFGSRFLWNSFVYVKIIFFRLKSGENLPVKETLHDWNPLDRVWTLWIQYSV